MVVDLFIVCFVFNVFGLYGLRCGLTWVGVWKVYSGTPLPSLPPKKGTIYQQNYLTLNLYFDICFLDTLILLNESMTLARAQSF